MSSAIGAGAARDGSGGAMDESASLRHTRTRVVSRAGAEIGRVVACSRRDGSAVSSAGGALSQCAVRGGAPMMRGEPCRSWAVLVPGPPPPRRGRRLRSACARSPDGDNLVRRLWRRARAVAAAVVEGAQLCLSGRLWESVRGCVLSDRGSVPRVAVCWRRDLSGPLRGGCRSARWSCARDASQNIRRPRSLPGRVERAVRFRSVRLGL
jgi:hypothetical protein